MQKTRGSAIEEVSVNLRAIRIPAELSQVSPLREQFSEFLQSIGLESAQISGWQLVFNEVLNNAIIHGADEDPSKRVLIEWSVVDAVCILAVQDPGKGPPIDAAAHLPDDPEQSHGRGRFIVSSFADELVEWRGSSGYRIEVRKATATHGNIEPPSAEMEAVLKELSASYEGLAAFYQLSESLVKSENLNCFLRSSLRDVQDSMVLDFLAIVPVADLPYFVGDHLQDLHQVADSSETDFERLLDRKCEIVWEDATQQRALGADIDLLSAFPSGCLLPITAEDRFLGLLVAGRSENSERMVSSQVSNLRTFADIFGIAIANFISTTIRREAERDLQEFEIAAEIQQHLLPIRPPSCESKRRAQVFQRAARNVAGDFAEYKQDRLGNHYLTIIDVMGKGVSAAMLGIIYRTAFNLMLDSPKPLPVMLERIGKALHHMLGELTMFITVTILRWNDETDVVEHVSAGHCPTVKMTPDGSTEDFEPSGPPIGLMPSYPYQCDVITTQPGDRLILVSDGCYEWRVDNQIFGWEELVSFLQANSQLGSESLWLTLSDLIEQSNPGAEPADDITLAIVQ